jgi:hypothetical protein
MALVEVSAMTALTRVELEASFVDELEAIFDVVEAT